MNKIIICVVALSLSACAGNSEVGERQQLTKRSDDSNCRMVKFTGSKLAKKVCSGGAKKSNKSD